jgi:hypothetical protein
VASLTSPPRCETRKPRHGLRVGHLLRAFGRSLYAGAAPDFFEAARLAANEAALIAIRVAVPGA